MVMEMFEDGCARSSAWTPAMTWASWPASANGPAQIIGGLLVDVFQGRSRQAPRRATVAWALLLTAQGTIYPGDPRVGRCQARRPSPSRACWRRRPAQTTRPLLEPLRDLFKDEVRELGMAGPAARNGLPPPSGPGLGVRILGRSQKSA